MNKIRVAIVGYGNIGQYTLQALQAAPDMEIAGVVRRRGAENKPASLNDYQVVSDIRELGHVDVAILATPTRSVQQYALEMLSMGINTVDSFDIHTQIVDLRKTLDQAAKEHGAVSIISAGWDPGSDSVVRTLMESLAPSGITYTNFGPGRSMGHSVAVRAIAVEEYAPKKMEQMAADIASADCVLVDLMGSPPGIIQAVERALADCKGQILPYGASARSYLRLGKFTALFRFSI